VQHLKLPHYVDFQSELELVRRLRAQHAAQSQDQGIEQRADQTNGQQEQAA
jgi:alpha-D-ribose 1-methylphosphonate 5-triphosphate synthase subunit PhnI